LPNNQFSELSNIEQQLWTLEALLVGSPPPATENFALAPDLKVECNDRLSSRNPAARNTETLLPEMPNAHDACAHLAEACRIRASHVRLLQMRSRRKNRHSVGSNEIRGCCLVRCRTTAANIDHASARHCRKARIENTRSRSFAGCGIHCSRNHHRCPILTYRKPARGIMKQPDGLSSRETHRPCDDAGPVIRHRLVTPRLVRTSRRRR